MVSWYQHVNKPPLRVCTAYGMGRANLNLSILGPHPGVVDVAVRVEPCERLKTVFLTAVVDEPTRRLGEDHDQ